MLFLYIKEVFGIFHLLIHSQGFQNKEAFVGVSSRQDYSNFASKYANALQWQNMVHVFHILCVVLTRISPKGLLGFYTCIFIV